MFERVRALAGRRNFAPAHFGGAALLGGDEGHRGFGVKPLKLALDDELVELVVGERAAAPGDFERARGHRRAVIIVGPGIVALGDGDLPAGLGLRLGVDETLGELDGHRVGRRAVAAVGNGQHRLDGGVVGGGRRRDAGMGEGRTGSGNGNGGAGNGAKGELMHLDFS